MKKLLFLIAFYCNYNSSMQNNIEQIQPELDENISMCRICLQEFDNDDDIVLGSIRFNCSDLHRYHRTCLNAWLARGSGCPACRQGQQTNNNLLASFFYFFHEIDLDFAEFVHMFFFFYS